jgi:hypothetical protein
MILKQTPFLNSLSFVLFIGYYVERPCAEEELLKASHPSELAVLDVKKMISETNIIKNDGNLEDLKNTVSNLSFTKVKPVNKTKESKFKFVLKK